MILNFNNILSSLRIHVLKWQLRILQNGTKAEIHPPQNKQLPKISPVENKILASIIS